MRLQAHIAEHKKTGSDTLSASELVFASAVSKMVASTATYPHEVCICPVCAQARMHGLAEVCKGGLPIAFRNRKSGPLIHIRIILRCSQNCTKGPCIVLVASSGLKRQGEAFKSFLECLREFNSHPALLVWICL
eukprot:1161564-Pelagomonas_calceolata.AAC.12